MPNWTRFTGRTGAFESEQSVAILALCLLPTAVLPADSSAPCSVCFPHSLHTLAKEYFGFGTASAHKRCER